MPASVSKMRALYPQHFTFVCLGFFLGHRPLTLRLLRRSGPTPNVLLAEGPNKGLTMSKMKAVQVSKAGGPLEVVEREVPQPGVGQVRVKVEACGVCHSDAFVKSGAFPGLSLPRIAGHEIAGKIDAAGSGVTAWKSGDRVGVGWHGGHCFECRAGFVFVPSSNHDVRYAARVVPTERTACVRSRRFGRTNGNVGHQHGRKRASGPAHLRDPLRQRRG